MALEWLAAAAEQMDDRIQAGRALARLADVQPWHAQRQMRAAVAMLRAGEVPAALERAARIASQDLRRRETSGAPLAWALVFPAHVAWLRGDVAAASRVVDDVSSRWASIPLAAKPALATFLLDWHLTLGQVGRAESAVARLASADARTVGTALVLLERGDRTELRDYLSARQSEEPVLESGEAPLAWLKMRRQLAGLYREAAQDKRARTIDTQVAALMAAADAVSSAGR